MAKNRDEYFRSYYQANKEKYAERGKAWRIANPDKALAFDRKWKAKSHDKIVKYRERTKEQRRAWQRKYEAESRDKEKAREASRKWRQLHGADYRRKWAAENPGKGGMYAARRRARKFYATPAWLTDADIREVELIYEVAARDGLDVDHIVPLQGKTVCGLHVPWNLQLLTPNANKTKANRLPSQHECIATISA